MINLILCIAFCLGTAFTAKANLTSPFPSSIDGITINNSHQIDFSDKLIRGMAPTGKIEELALYGITDILIFKNQTRKEIDKELAEIKKKELEIEVTRIDFLWHDIPSYKLACEQVIEALRLMRNISQQKNRKLFFHCTVGEDRTGILSGLWRMLKLSWTKDEAFYGEMCKKGYETGNPNKPWRVTSEIRKDLTPLFQYMAQLIEDKKISIGYLSKNFCRDSIDMEVRYKCKKPTN